MVQQLADDMAMAIDSEFWHRADDITLQEGKDVYPDNDDGGLWARFVDQGFEPDDHFRRGGDTLAWTGWAAYAAGWATPSVQNYENSMLQIAHNASVRAFKYITVTPAASQCDIAVRVAANYSCEIGLMVDDGVDAGDGEGANNFLRVFIRSPGAVSSGPPIYRYEYRAGGGAKTILSATHSLLHQSFYGLWLSTRGTEWSSWNPRIMTFGEAAISSISAAGRPSIGALWTTAPAGQTWTPARVGIYYRNLATSFNDFGAVDWFYSTF